MEIKQWLTYIVAPEQEQKQKQRNPFWSNKNKNKEIHSDQKYLI